MNDTQKVNLINFFTYISQVKRKELTQTRWIDSTAELCKLMMVLNQRGLKYNKNCSVYFVEDLTFFYVLEWVGDDQFDFGNLRLWLFLGLTLNGFFFLEHIIQSSIKFYWTKKKLQNCNMMTRKGPCRLANIHPNKKIIIFLIYPTYDLSNSY